jgi:hypothetical protein
MLQSHWESKRRKGGKGKGKGERDQDLFLISLYYLALSINGLEIVGIQDDITRIEPNGPALEQNTTFQVLRVP